MQTESRDNLTGETILTFCRSTWNMNCTFKEQFENSHFSGTDAGARLSGCYSVSDDRVTYVSETLRFFGVPVTVYQSTLNKEYNDTDLKYNAKITHNTVHKEPGWHSRYSDSLRAGRSGDRIPVRARFSAPNQTGSEAHPASCTMGTGSFPGVKAAGAWR
jgi:hypothetical protein